MRRRLVGAIGIGALAVLGIGLASARSGDTGLRTERAAIVTTTTHPSTTLPAPTSAPTVTSTTTAPSAPAPPARSSPTTSVTATPAPRSLPLTAAARTSGAVLLVWTSGGLPDGFAADVTSIPQVRSHTTVQGDMIRLLETRDAGGRVIDRPADGWAIPIDAFAVDPASYSSFAPSPDADVLARLEPGQAVLTRSSSLLRRLAVGGVLRFEGGSVTVTGVVADESAGGAEVVVHRDDAARLRITRTVHPPDRLRSRGRRAGDPGAHAGRRVPQPSVVGRSPLAPARRPGGAAGGGQAGVRRVLVP